jgi:hypothetical protein
MRVYVRCSDGTEGDWEFDIVPRVGERVTLQGPYGYYQVVKVEHFPVSAETGSGPPSSERGIGIRLLLLDQNADPVWG